MSNAIETVGLAKDYGGGHGLFGLDLTIPPGEVFGFLGPNGAGKTTAIRLLMGMIRPTAGSASIFGLDCRRDAVAVKRLVGYLPGDLPQFGGLRGAEVVAYLGGLRGGLDPARVGELARRLDLDLGRPFRQYSRGNKQKLGIVLAFMHRPRLLILDEPTGGLDPLNQQEFYGLVRDAREDGATVFLSSHILSEVEHTCDRVGIIRDGRLVRLSGLADLHHIRVHRVEAEFEGEAPAAAFRLLPGVEDVRVDGPRLSFIVRGAFDPVLAELSRQRVLNLTSHEPSLEDVFLAYYREPEPAAGS